MDKTDTSQDSPSEYSPTPDSGSISIKCPREHYSITVELTASAMPEAMSYALLRARDIWPEAIMNTGRDTYETYTEGHPRSFRNVKSVCIFPCFDRIIAGQLFRCQPDSVMITRHGNELEITGYRAGVAVVRHFAKMPFWRHRTSARLQAV